MNLDEQKEKTAISGPCVDICLDCGTAISVARRDYFDTRFGHSGFYGIARCGACSLEQTLPRPAERELQALYETFYNFRGEKGTRYTQMRERFLLSVFYQLWLWLDGDISFHARKGTGRLLDVGCNEGRGLKLYRNNGFSAEGLEFNENAARVARASGFTVHTVPLSAVAAQTYDRVVLSNVLEHSLDPAKMLADIRRLLKPRGQLWISCPNSESWLRRLFGRFWINWHVPFHIVHFSRASLRRQIEKAGLSVVEMKTQTPALWLVQSFLSRWHARHGHPTRELRSVARVVPLLLLTRLLLFPIIWLGNALGRGDCWIVVAQNRNPPEEN